MYLLLSSIIDICIDVHAALQKIGIKKGNKKIILGDIVKKFDHLLKFLTATPLAIVDYSLAVLQ